MEPAKVIVVYDLYENIINPGINLVDGTLTGSTSDVLYDSEKTILDNIYRTLIVKKDVNQIFYKNDDEILLNYKYHHHFYNFL